MSIKEYLTKEKEKRSNRLSEIDNEVAELNERNDKCDKEDELREIGDSLDELKAEKAEKEAEIAEIDAQIAELEKEEKAKREEKPVEEGDPKEEKPNPQRSNFLVFEKRNGGQVTMTQEERKQLEARSEAFKTSGKMKIEKPQLRAVTIASGQIAVPTEVHGIENPAEVPYSTILDFVKVVDMTGAGYNKISLLEEYSEASAKSEGETISESNPTFGNVTIQPEKGFKTLSTISNEVLKTSPLNYYGKVEESAMVALRRKVANLIVTKMLGATDDDDNEINAKISVSAIDEKTLRTIAFAFGGDEGIFGSATLVLNKKTLSALGDVYSDLTKQAVYEIEPNGANPNIGIIRKGGLSCRYILSNAIPAFDEVSEGQTFAIYGDMKSVEVDLFGAYDIKVSEDYKFDQDLLAIRGVAQVGVGVARLHGLIEVQKGAAVNASVDPNKSATKSATKSAEVVSASAGK